MVHKVNVVFQDQALTHKDKTLNLSQKNLKKKHHKRKKKTRRVRFPDRTSLEFSYLLQASACTFHVLRYRKCRCKIDPHMTSTCIVFQSCLQALLGHIGCHQLCGVSPLSSTSSCPYSIPDKSYFKVSQVLFVSSIIRSTTSLRKEYPATSLRV